MNKYNKLLKKIELFEKLACYGDRSSFLKAIAQESNTKLLFEAQRLLQEAGVTSQPIAPDMKSILADISGVLMGTKGDLSPLSDEYKKLKSIKNQLVEKPLTGEVSPMVGGTAQAEEYLKQFPVTKAPFAGSFTPIDKQQQRAVFQFVIDENLDTDKKILPGGTIEEKFIDGKLGKQTRAALEAVKNYFAKLNPKNLRMSDQEAITAAQTPKRI